MQTHSAFSGPVAAEGTRWDSGSVSLTLSPHPCAAPRLPSPPHPFPGREIGPRYHNYRPQW